MLRRTLASLCSAWIAVAAVAQAAPLSSALQAPRLTQNEAAQRAQQVSGVNYGLKVDLSGDGKTFSGEVSIDFVLHPRGHDLRVDFNEGHIESLTRDGQALRFRREGGALYIAEAQLAAEQRNRLVLRYQHAYSKDGNGLYRFLDPVDHSSYVYTHFEPYSANRFFPCFDQPDLKASYTVEVLAPANWTVVSALREQRIDDLGSKRRWIFPQTERFSTYLIALHAGPFQVWEDPNYRYPLRLMARRSLAAYVPHAEWLAMSRHGFDFYEKIFGYAYPFKKYDQVVVPDFNAGAMENVAAVTFSERFLVRGQRSSQHKERLAHTLLHEMAHMWFGDLVTMRWWDDLWLNESFATYASTMALAAHPDYPETWLGFSRSKQNTYDADQLVTTHPIAGTIAHTDEALSNFDAITYGKGAAFLRVLHATLGEAPFQKGLQLYFKRHAFQNTVMQDFISALEEGSGRPLQAMSSGWLQTAGANVLSVDAQCDAAGKQLLHLTLKQAAPAAHPTLREHTAKIGLYTWNTGTGLAPIDQPVISYKQAETKWNPPVPLACPDLVFPNEDEQDYVRVKLDAKTLKLGRDELQQIRSPALRLMVWNSVTMQVEAAELSLLEFARMVQVEAPREPHLQVLRAIDATMERLVMPVVTEMPLGRHREQMLAALASGYEQLLAAPQAELDRKLLAFDTYVELLELGERRSELLAMLEGKRIWTGLSMDQDKRWKLIGALSALGAPTARSLLAAEQRRDQSSQGQRQARAARASLPDYKQKLQLIEPIVAGTSKLAAADRIATIRRLFPSGQGPLLQRYAASYVHAVPEVVRRLEPGVAHAYVVQLLPLGCNKSQLPVLERWLAANFAASIHKDLLEARQLNERCMSLVQKLDGSS